MSYLAMQEEWSELFDSAMPYEISREFKKLNAKGVLEFKRDSAVIRIICNSEEARDKLCKGLMHACLRYGFKLDISVLKEAEEYYLKGT